jgi:hypothetical protein
VGKLYLRVRTKVILWGCGERHYQGRWLLQTESSSIVDRIGANEMYSVLVLTFS